jgi:DNA polymerase-1
MGLAGETFNLSSPKQLATILFEKMGIHPPKKTDTGFSTDADVLEKLSLDHPIAAKILEWRSLEKLRSTYIEKLPQDINPRDGRIHPTFNQAVAATGRLSCQDPNLQNIPVRSELGKEIRAAFRPEKKGWSYLAADYSQIELRLLAHLSEDPKLIDAFFHNEDIHKRTAADVMGIPLDEVTSEMRRQAKAVNFGILYGQSDFGLARELGIPRAQAAAFIQSYFERYPEVKRYIERCKEEARQTGRSKTLTGRERLIPEIHSKNGMIRQAAERLAVNTPLQGTSADLIKLAMIAIQKKLKERKTLGYMVLQIHDELIFEIPDEEIPFFQEIVPKYMQSVFDLKVPLIVDVQVGKNWKEC